MLPFCKLSASDERREFATSTMTKLFYCILTLSVAGLSTAGDDNRQRLAANLLASYDTGVLPVVGEAKLPLLLQTENALAQVYDVDDNAQTITVILWMRLYWRDEKLSWDPDEYGGLDNLKLPVDRVWRPILVADNGYVNSE